MKLFIGALAMLALWYATLTITYYYAQSLRGESRCKYICKNGTCEELYCD